VHVSEGQAGEVIGDGCRPLVIAIDGPSGSGKSTTARGVARRLDLAFLDTGAMYRAITWLVLQQGLDSADEPAVARLARDAELAVNTDPQTPSVAVNGQDVTEAIRHPDVSAAVSAIATNLDVRRELVSRQRELITGAAGGIVAEGRDVTTVVAPDAQVRVLLVADPAARVARRHAELGERIDAAAVTDQVIRRDQDDSTVAQFHSAGPGVVVLDSTSLSLEEVIDAICALAPESYPHRLDDANLAGAGEDVAR
jgi:CMP/dCMP kinase